ncbi:MAG: hypothetical protein WA208_04705, partial [Thermoanaerobaculia bacterium]
RERITQVIGSAADDALYEIDREIDETKVSGYVTRGVRFGSRRNQFFFVNGRLVKDKVLTHAATRACEAFDFDGHPAIVLFLDLPPEMVDVNVHPAKTEVRFRDSSRVHVSVEHALRRALGGAEEGSSLLRESDTPLPSAFAASHAPALFAPQRFDAPRADFTPLFQREAVVQPPVGTAAGAFNRSSLAETLPLQDEPVPDLGDLQGRVIGQYRMSYILLDNPGGLRLVDQHVAHERVLYDQFIARVEARTPVSQTLLAPIVYEAGAAECAALETHLDELRAVGFDIERFSGNSFAISATPAELIRNSVTSFLRKLIDASAEEKSSHVTRVRERIAASLACQAAIKVHRPLGGGEMASLVADLLRSSNPFACPHGRPIIVDIRHGDIERHFHRR